MNDSSLDDVGQEKDYKGAVSGITSGLKYETSRSPSISKFTSLNKSDVDLQADSDDPDKTEGKDEPEESE